MLWTIQPSVKQFFMFSHLVQMSYKKQKHLFNGGFRLKQTQMIDKANPLTLNAFIDYKLRQSVLLFKKDSESGWKKL